MPSSGRGSGTAATLLLAGLAAGCGGVAPEAVERPPESATLRRIDPPAAPGGLAPNLTLLRGRPALSWLEPLAAGGHRLAVSTFDGGAWSAPVTVVEGDRFFANWADLPAVVESGDGSLVAHWLARTGEGTYAYSPFVARSRDGGASWVELGRLDDDDTPSEHGFVSYAPERGGLRAFWLDGRGMAGGGPMELRTALIGEAVGASERLDLRVCECCSTDAASAAAGPLVVYRDRSEDEIRDVALVRSTGNGWSSPAVAQRDDWTIAGCPVNGPAVDALDDRVGLAWFTGADGSPRVQVAFSRDGGASFGPAVLIDGNGPAGRVDLVLDGAGGAVVAWLGIADGSGAVRLRWISAAGELGEPLDVAVTGAARASGFPRLARLGERLHLAWVDTTPDDGQRIRVVTLALADLPRPTWPARLTEPRPRRRSTPAASTAAG